MTACFMMGSCAAVHSTTIGRLFQQAQAHPEARFAAPAASATITVMTEHAGISDAAAAGRRPSMPARLFFLAFDLLAGRRTTLHKLCLLERLASVPYRAWENRAYLRLSRCPGDPCERRRALELVAWARSAQDNEYGHLLALQELAAEEQEKRPWYGAGWVVRPVFASYRLLSWALARACPRCALRFNAEFEAHAERTYARFVADHPEWERRPLSPGLEREHGAGGWAGLLRAIARDERDHRERSLQFAGQARKPAPGQGGSTCPPSSGSTRRR
jgi:hypothetical protein